MSATISSCCCLFALLLVKYYTGNVFYLATPLCYGAVLSHSWVSLICMARDTEWSHLILLLSAFLGHSIKSYRIAHCCLCNDSNKFKKNKPPPSKFILSFKSFQGKLHSASININTPVLEVACQARNKIKMVSFLDSYVTCIIATFI